MNKTDITTGRIIQRIIDSRCEGSPKTIITHGVSNQCDVYKIIDYILNQLPNCVISIKRLKFGYELKFEIEWE